MYYDSDASYSSFDSYDSAEHRSRRHRSKRHGNDRSSRRGHRSSKREKRRRDDSDDEGIGGGGGGGGVPMHGMNSNNNSGNNRNNNNNNQPRKPELCKFYLMECCAKGEKCLYMHGDFPCKFYYLGMGKSHNRETCKFSHGKPLSEQMRALLLKHLETAPKEILGDFPRLARETAVNMLTSQHIKLCAKFDIEPEPGMNLASSGQSSKMLPSLLDLNLTKYPPPNDMSLMGMGNSKSKDKPRKSRWCDQRGMENSSSNSMLSSNSLISGVNVNVPPPSANATQQSEHDFKLSSLTGTLTAEQVDKLAKMGIETISQITQLTVLQVIELGLSIALISELQLKAVQLQQNKQTKPKQQAQHVPATVSSSSETKQNPFSKGSREAANRDQDMRISMNSSSVQEKIDDNSLLNQDIDMRILAMPPTKNVSDKHKRSDSEGSKNNTQHGKQASENTSTRKLIDYSQYLKDANIDMNQSDLEEPLGKSFRKMLSF